jgi:hypothetical protein
MFNAKKIPIIKKNNKELSKKFLLSQDTPKNIFYFLQNQKALLKYVKA